MLGETWPPDDATLRWMPSIASHSRMGGNAVLMTATTPL
jgi:hypothetical protein